MKKSFLGVTMVAASSVLLVSGCAEPTPPPPQRVYMASPEPVVVPQAPPSPQTEVVVPSPGPAYVWVPGYWSWQGRWVWVRGGWYIAPRPHATWVPGHWVHHGYGYVWIAGHWR